MWRRAQRAAIYMSSLFFVFCFHCVSLAFFVSFVLVVGAKEGNFARMGPAWPGALAPERQVQGVWGAGSPPGNVEYDELFYMLIILFNINYYNFIIIDHNLI